MPPNAKFAKYVVMNSVVKCLYICGLSHSVRNVSLGRNDDDRGNLHSVRNVSIPKDASLTGCGALRGGNDFLPKDASLTGCRPMTHKPAMTRETAKMTHERRHSVRNVSLGRIMIYNDLPLQSVRIASLISIIIERCNPIGLLGGVWSFFFYREIIPNGITTQNLTTAFAKSNFFINNTLRSLRKLLRALR